MSTEHICLYDHVVAKNYNFHPVFEKGLVVNAWLAKDKIRMVTIEDYTVSNPNGESSVITSDKTRAIYIGKHGYIENAFKDALIGFHKDIPYARMYRWGKNVKKGSDESSSQLDHWLLGHQGIMRALQDIDGTILCTLEGLETPESQPSDRIVLEGAGSNLMSALRDAFSKLDKDSIETTLARHIKVNSF